MTKKEQLLIELSLEECKAELEAVLDKHGFRLTFHPQLMVGDDGTVRVGGDIGLVKIEKPISIQPHKTTELLTPVIGKAESDK